MPLLLTPSWCYDYGRVLPQIYTTLSITDSSPLYAYLMLALLGEEHKAAILGIYILYLYYCHR